MNATVGDQLDQRLPSYLSTDWVEAADDHDTGRIVDNDVDSGRLLERRKCRPSRPMIRPFISSLGIDRAGGAIRSMC